MIYRFTLDGDLDPTNSAASSEAYAMTVMPSPARLRLKWSIQRGNQNVLIMLMLTFLTFLWIYWPVIQEGRRAQRCVTNTDCTRDMTSIVKKSLLPPINTSSHTIASPVKKPVQPHNDSRSGGTASLVKNRPPPENDHRPYALPPFVKKELLPKSEECATYRQILARRKVVHPFVFGKDRKQVDPNDITLYTQFALNRVDRLLRVFQNWDGPICAVMTGNLTDIHELQRVLKNSNISKHRDDVWIHALENYAHVHHLPICELRNVALKYVATDYVFLIDVDNVPKNDTHARMKRRVAIDSKNPQMKSKIAYVIPTFESTTDEHFEMPQTKQDLAIAAAAGDIIPFYMTIIAGCHMPTDFPRWWKTNTPYMVKYEYIFEPFVVARKSELPAFNPALFRYRDKVAHVYAMNLTGFQFLVLPDVYQVHMYHSRNYTKISVTDTRCGDEAWNMYVEWLATLTPEQVIHSEL